MPGRSPHSNPQDESLPRIRGVLLSRDGPQGDPRLLVQYRGRAVHLELVCRGVVFWSGPWDVNVASDGRRLELLSPWRQTRWLPSEKIDYLELESVLTGGVRLVRHLAMAHGDGLILLADTLQADGSSRLDYRSKLALVEGLRFEPAGETGEGVLRAPGRRIRVLPLALPEWRCHPARVGTLSHAGQGLRLHQYARATSLFAPLLFDLDGRRAEKRLTWRQLTVGEKGRAVAADVAVGYRVMLADRQWLFYRSLTGTANRTLLGHNLFAQMLIARFHRDGKVEALVTVD